MKKTTFKCMLIILFTFGVFIVAMAEDRNELYDQRPIWFEDVGETLSIINRERINKYYLDDIIIAFGSSNNINANAAMEKAKEVALSGLIMASGVIVDNVNKGSRQKNNIVLKGIEVAMQQSKKDRNGRAYIALYITKDDLKRSMGLKVDAVDKMDVDISKE